MVAMSILKAASLASTGNMELPTSPIAFHAIKMAQNMKVANMKVAEKENTKEVEMMIKMNQLRQLPLLHQIAHKYIGIMSTTIVAV